ncbi:MAG TPA: potassium channel protein [Flavobacteriales bacterium]|nr:potassium channel protein [Flavobacteriales bacterium]
MKEHIYKTLNGYKANTSYGKRFDLLISSLIVLNVIAFILSSYPKIHAEHHRSLYWFELFSVVVFSIEYLLRLFTADLLYPELSGFKARLKFAFSFYGVIDLLAILPFYLPMIGFGDMRFIRAFRLMRLVRLFKLNRHSSNIRMLGDILKEKKKDMLIVVSSVLIILIIAASLMYSLEKDEQPDVFPHIGAAIWWALATLTTIGYGDIIPATALGRVLSGVIALLGIAIVALPTGILSSAFIERIQKHKEHKSPSKGKFCPTAESLWNDEENVF